MKLKYLLLSFVFLPCMLWAQVTIDSDDFPKVGDRLVFRINNSTSALSPGDTGQAQVWDFRSFNQQFSEQFVVINPLTAPNLDSFPNANLVLSARQGLDFSFFHLTDTAFYSLGSFLGTVETENSLLTVNEPPILELTFPTSFGTKFQSTTIAEQNLGDIGNGTRLIFVSVAERSSEV
ncbi:MAG: hypothetical protein AAF705_02555, partial [Bacteroidota bacterium]